jgi:two-component system OmpR family sensor kinase
VKPGRRPLGRQLAMLTTAVAALAVLLAAVVSIGLVRGAAADQARRTLARQADGYAALLDRPARRAQAVRLATLLRRQGLDLVTVTEAGTPVGPDRALLPTDLATRISGGTAVSTVLREGGARRFVEGRPVEGGGGIVLIEAADTAAPLTDALRWRLLIALAVGLAGAAVAGLVLGRRLARPLQVAARAAGELSAGHRDVRLRPEGPAEVAAVAEALSALAEALAHSEQRQREFLLSVSHELRTPLTAVRGSAEAIADGVVEGEDARAAARVALAESDRLERLVRDLLDLARLGADDFRVDLRPVDLADLVRAAEPTWRGRCQPAGVTLVLELPAHPVIVHTDAGRVRQILDGLAENALRVTPREARIVFAVRDSTDPAAGPAVLLEVRDAGPGLTEDDLTVAFERSALYERYRGRRRVGTGLGLALVAGLAERLGGTATATAAPEGGAAFAVRLPLPGPPGNGGSVSRPPG